MLRLGRSNFSNSCNRQRDFAGRTPRAINVFRCAGPTYRQKGRYHLSGALLDPPASHNRRPTGS